MIRDVVNPVAVFINPIGFHIPVFILTVKDTSGYGLVYEVKVDRRDEMICAPTTRPLMVLDDDMPGWVRAGKPATFTYTPAPAQKTLSMSDIVLAFHNFIRGAINGYMLFVEFCDQFALDPESHDAFSQYLQCQEKLRKTRLLQLNIDHLYRIDDGIETRIYTDPPYIER